MKETLPYEIQSMKQLLTNTRTRLKKRDGEWNAKSKSREALVQSRHIPIGGLAKLRSNFESVGEKFALITKLAEYDVPISQEEYQFTLDFTLMSLYMYSPNARPMAINELTVEGEKLLESLGRFDSSAMKTVISFGAQPILTHTLIGKQILAAYRTYTRPQAIRRRSKGHSAADTAFFVDFRGKRVTKGYASRRIRTFNVRYGGYNANVTDIRRMIETDTTLAALEGSISEVAARAMMVGQGHSIQTVMKHYVKIDRLQSSRYNTATFDLVTASIAGNQREIAPPSPAVVPMQRQPPEWWSHLPPVELAVAVPDTDLAVVIEMDGLSDSGESVESSVEDDGAADAGRDAADTGPPGRPLVHGFSDWGLNHPQGLELGRQRYIWSDGEFNRLRYVYLCIYLYAYILLYYIT
jgi:hypothetical protein